MKSCIRKGELLYMYCPKYFPIANTPYAPQFKMSAEQIGQLYELMHATKDVWKTQAELASESPSSQEPGADTIFGKNDNTDKH